jgi:HEAT repeat protein
MEAKSWGRRHGFFQVSVARRMVLVAVVSIPALNDPRTEVRIAAIESVGKLGDICRAPRVAPGQSAGTSAIVEEAKQIAAVLLQALHDPAIHVRAAAVKSLADVGPLAGIDPGPIIEALENGPALDVRAAATGTLYAGWPEYSGNVDVLGR